MNAGELNEVIKVYHVTTTTTATGAETQTETLLGEFRAKAVFGKQWRSVVNDEIYYARSIYFTVRSYVNVCETDTIEWQGERYRIISLEIKREEQCKELTTELIHE